MRVDKDRLKNEGNSSLYDIIFGIIILSLFISACIIVPIASFYITIPSWVKVAAAILPFLFMFLLDIR